MFIELFSVGTTVDTETLDTYATNADGTPDLEGGSAVPLRECVIDWYEELDDEDFGTVEFLLNTNKSGDKNGIVNFR